MLFGSVFEPATSWPSYTATHKQTGRLCLLPAVSTVFLPVVLRRHIPPYSRLTGRRGGGGGGEASGLLACNTTPPRQTSYQGRFFTTASRNTGPHPSSPSFYFPKTQQGNLTEEKGDGLLSLRRGKGRGGPCRVAVSKILPNGLVLCKTIFPAADVCVWCFHA